MKTMKLYYGLAIIALVICPASIRAAMLTATYTRGKCTNVNLTTEGPGDWNLWGTDGATSFTTPSEQKAGGTAIGDLTVIDPNGRGLANLAHAPSHTFSWTDGVPDATGDGVLCGVQTAANPRQVGAGFSFTVPAGTAISTMSIYTTQYSQNTRLSAWLSDDSASAVESVTPWVTYEQMGRWDLTFSAGSAGSTLYVTMVGEPTSDIWAMIGIHAVTTDIPEPATAVLLALGLPFVMRRRRRS